MATNKQELLDHLYQGLQDVDLSISPDSDRRIPITKALSPLQLYEILLQIVNLIPDSDADLVIEVTNINKIPKETTHIVEDFKHKDIQFNTLLKEVILLGKSLGYENSKLYATFIEVFNIAKLESSAPTITKVSRALTEILFATYATFHNFNLTPIQRELIQAIHKGHMDKLINKEAAGYITTLSDTVAQYKEIDREVISVDLKNGYIAVKDRDTLEILNPIDYRKPDIEEIIIKHLNKKE